MLPQLALQQGSITFIRPLSYRPQITLKHNLVSLGTEPEVLHRRSRKILAWSRVFLIMSPIIRQYVIRDKELEVEDARG
jgi:hypothetical protein